MVESREQSPLAVVQGIYTAVHERGIEAMLDCFDELLSEDFEWTPALVGTIEGGRTYVGREQMAEYLVDFKSAFQEADFGEPFYEEHDQGRVLIVAPMRVKGAGSGLPLELEVAYVVEVRDGRASKGRTFFSRGDAEEFLRSA